MGSKMSMPDLTGPNFQVVMVGLDNAGKSTILYRLKTDEYCETAPTIGFNCEKFKPSLLGRARGSTFSIWDVGGQEKLRPLWRSYVRQTDAIVFVVDSTDLDRFEECRLELSTLLKCADLPATVPLVLLANKQDLPAALTESEVETAVGFLGKDIQNTSRPHRTFGCCAVTGEGVENLFEHLHELIQQSRQLVKNKRKSR